MLDGSGIGSIGLFVVLDVPRGQAVAADDGGPHSAVNFDTFRVSRPEGRGSLNDTRCAGLIRKQSVDDVFRLDLVARTDLPQPIHCRYRSHKIKQNVDLMNSLIDKRAAAFCAPTPLDWSRIVFVGTKPLDVSVSFEQFAEPPGGESTLQKKN